jgi:hypothetical protein
LDLFGLLKQHLLGQQFVNHHHHHQQYAAEMVWLQVTDLDLSAMGLNALVPAGTSAPTRFGDNTEK